MLSRPSELRELCKSFSDLSRTLFVHQIENIMKCHCAHAHVHA